MKILQNYTFTFLFLLFINSQLFGSATCTAVKNFGDWSDKTTWDKGAIPENGDQVIIPAAITVNVTTNLYPAVSKLPTLEVKIYGVLNLLVGQLNLSCGSSICVLDNGSIYGYNSNDSQIMFGGGNADWKGMFDGTISTRCIYGECSTLEFEPVSFKAKNTSNTTSVPSLSIFPNPIQHQSNFTIDLIDAESFELSIVNSQSQLVSQTTGRFGVPINAPELPGYYTVSIRTNTAVFHKLILVL
jgi:hypothetical protein